MRSTINICFVIVGNAFSVFFLHFLVCTGLWSGFRLLFVWSFSFCIFCSRFFQSRLQLCHWVFVGCFFSEVILDICELILSLPGFHVAMQCNDAITCVLASPSLLPFLGNQVRGDSYTGKKNCVRDDSRGKVLLWSSWVLPVVL